MREKLPTALGCLVVLLTTALAVQASPYSDYVTTYTNPVIYWDLGETSGTTAADLVTSPPAGANNGTYTANGGHSVALGGPGPRPSDGFLAMDSANAAPTVDYHGTAKYDQLTSTAQVPTNSYSYQLWFNSDVPFTNNALQYLFTRGNGTADADRRDAVYVGGSYSGIVPNKLHLISGTPGESAVIGNRTLAPGEWYNMTFVRDGADTKVYLNGSLEVQTTKAWAGGSGEFLTAGNRTDYDRFPSTTGLGVHGNFDEVAIWDRALTDTEARSLYRQALGISDPYPAAVMGKNSEAYWRLDETTGTNTAADRTGNGHTFAYNASPTRTGTGTDVGPRPTAFGGFDADNNAPTLVGGPLVSGNGYLGSPTGVLAGQNDYTIDMWVRPGTDMNPHPDYLIHRDDPGGPADEGDFLGIRSSGGTYGNLYIFDGSTSVNGLGTTLEKDEWYHVAMVREGNDVTVYLNGQVEIPSTTMAPTGTHTAGTWTFGGRLDMPWQQKFSGNMDEIAIYNDVLPPRDVEENYLSATVNRSAPYARAVLRDSAEAYWRLNETEPYGLAIDATGNNHTMDYNASASHTGTGADVGPQRAEFGGFEADNGAPTIAGGPLVAGDGYVGVATGVLPGTPGGQNNDYSAEMWIRRDDDPNQYGDYILHRSDASAPANTGDFLSVSDYAGTDSYTLGVYSGDGSIPAALRKGTTQLQKGEWYHVAMTRNGDDVKVYLNGLQEISLTMPSTAGTSWADGTWAIGGRLDLPKQQKFAGNIDEVAIYGRTLDTVDFQENYCTATIRRDAPYAQAVLGDSPEAYWRLDEVEPYVTAVDATGNGHTFLYHDSTSHTGTGSDVGPRAFAGFEADNNAPTLTGRPLNTQANGYLGIPSGVLPGENDYSVEMWFNLDHLDSIGSYLMHRNDLDAGGEGGDYLGLHNGDEPGEVNLFIFNGWASSGYTSISGLTDIVEDEWYHLAMTRDGNDVRVYLNGVLEIAAPMGLQNAAKWTDGGWTFGGRSFRTDLSQRFFGQIDEIAIYGGALDQSVLQSHWQAAVPEPTTIAVLSAGLLTLLRRRRRTR